MTCEHVSLPGGGAAVVCGRGKRPIRCAECGRPGDRLCDWKVLGGTCDKPLCAACSFKPARGKDLCTEHAADFKAWEARRA